MAYDDGGDIGSLGIIGSWVDETGNGNSIVRAKPNGTDYIAVIVQKPTGATIEYSQYYLIGCQVGSFNSNFPCYITVRQQKVTVNNGYILGDKSGVWAAVNGCIMKSGGTENNYRLSEINSSTITIKPIVQSGGDPQPTPTPPSKPTNLNIGGASEKWIYYTNSFTLSWSGNSDASGYNIYFDGNKKISTAYTTYTFNGLSMSDIGTHSITVRAYNIDYSSEQSNTVTLYVCGEVLLKDGMNTSTLYNQGNTWKIEYNLSSYTPTKQGYIFDGWYTQPTGGTQVTGTIQLKNYGSVTYYAHWRSGAAQEFTITFDDNGGTGGPGTRQTTNQKLVIPNQLPTKGGTSGGSSEGTSGFCSKEVAAAILGNFWYEGGMDPTRWEGRWGGDKPNERLGYGLGQWTNKEPPEGRRTNLINYLANNNLPYTNEQGAWINNTGTDYQYRAGKAQVDYLRLENTWYAYVTIYHIPGQNRINSNFNSWQLSSFLSSTSTDVDMLAKEFLYFWESPFYPGQTAEKVQSEETNRITAARRVYEYINEHWNDTSISNANFMTNPNKIGENSSGDKALNDDQRLKNALILARYMVGYSNTPTPGITGATCLGWSLTKDGPLAYTVGQTVTFNANTRLYAVWASDKTITYNGTGSDSGLPPAPQSAGYNVTIKISGNTGNLKKTGYEFDTWKKEGGTDIYSFGQNYTGSASLSLVPNWTGKVYKITYSGLGSPTEATVRFGDRFVFPAAPSKQGYDFTGWQLNDTIYQPGDVITSWNIASDVTITATWKKQTSWRMIIPWIYIEE